MVKFKASIKQIASKQLVSNDRGVRLTIDIPILADTNLDDLMEGLNQCWGDSKNESGELSFSIDVE